MSDNDISECRICFEPQTIDNIFIYPCACNGTSKYVHIKCLKKWRDTTTNLIAKKRCKFSIFIIINFFNKTIN